MAVKLLGLGLKSYLSDSMNQFDALIVIISITEFIMATDSSDNVDVLETGMEDTSITLFRGFRLLRVFRLARSWDSFHKMMVKIGQTIKDIMNFFVLLLIVVFVFSLLGVELFNNYVRFDDKGNIVPIDDPKGKSPTQNFDSFENSFVSIFVCLIGEDWQLIMHDYVRAKQNRLIPNIYFMILMIIGNLFLMNLFLAILLKNFQQENHEEPQEEKDDFSYKIKNYVTEQRVVHKLQNELKDFFQKFFKSEEKRDEIRS